MAFAERAGSKAQAAGSAVDSLNVAFAQNVVSGNLLVVAGGLWDNPQNSSIAVSGSLHAAGWTVYRRNVGANFTAFLAWRVASSSGAETVTVNPNNGSGAAYIEAAVNEYTAGAVIELDEDGTNPTTGTNTTPTASITTSTTAGLIVGVTVPDTDTIAAQTTLTPSGSYTEWAEQESVNNSEFNAVHRITAAANTYSVDWTLGNSGPWGVVVMSFKEQAGAAASLVHRHLLLGIGT